MERKLYGFYQDFSGNRYKIADEERWILINTTTGEPERFGRFGGRHAVMTKGEALKLMLRSPQGPIRYAAVKLDCIVSTPDPIT